MMFDHTSEEKLIMSEAITSEVFTPTRNFAPPRRFDSEEAFETWCDEDIRAEYLNGEVIMHCPAGTVHEKSIQWLSALLEFFIARDELGEIFGSNTQMRLADWQAPPAGFGLCCKRMNFYALDEEQKYVSLRPVDGKLFSKVLPGFWLKPEWFWQQPLPNVAAIAREMGIL